MGESGGPPDKCSVPDCPAPPTSRCGGCGKVSYCSKEHQKQDWKRHKGECCVWKVSTDKRVGRHLIAVRDVKAGEIIMREKPLLLTPPKITLPVCLGCYSEFRPDGAETDDGRGVKPYPCQHGCGFPMCKSPHCSNSRDHAEAECAIARKSSKGKVSIRNADCEHPTYQLVALLRVLGLKDKDPSSYEKLMTLESHSEERDELRRKMDEEHKEFGGYFASANASEVKPIVASQMLKEFFQRSESEVREEWISKVFGIIETNGHEIPIPDEDGHINRRIIGVYHTSSFLEHNCVPNCVKTWDLSSNKEIVIRSSLPIKKGDHLSISYVDPLWGTQDRVSLLKMTKFFTCTCTRCQDPTELGCHISSLRCQRLGKCAQSPGLVTPLDPSKPDTFWKCGTCGEDYEAGYATSLIHKAGQELEEAREKVTTTDVITKKEEYLKRFGKTLAPNHFHLLEMKVELSQLYGRTEDEPLHLMPPKKLLRKVQLCEEILKVLNVISPGFTRIRGLILYELQAAALLLSQLRYGAREISLDKHLEELMQVGKWMTEVIKVLGWEPFNSFERKRAIGAERELQHLRNAVLSLQNPTGGSPPTPSPSSAEDKNKKGSSSEEKDKKKNTNKNEEKGGKDEVGSLENQMRSHLTVDEESFIEEVF